MMDVMSYFASEWNNTKRRAQAQAIREEDIATQERVPVPAEEIETLEDEFPTFAQRVRN